MPKLFCPQWMVLAFLAVLLSACASTPEAVMEHDPFEPANRALFTFDEGLDDNLALPLAKGYRAVLPQPVRDGVHNFLENLTTPVTFVNDVLEGHITLGGQTIGRVVVNTTLGLGGLFDVATHIGIPDHTADFGQTLGVWGVDEGPYLVLPLLGPSTVRDAVGKVADIFTDPFTYIRFDGSTGWQVARYGVTFIDERERNIETVDQIKAGAVDFYATTRSLYRQHRESEIHPEAAEMPEGLPNF